MIIYSKAWGGLHLLLRLYGSAFPRTLLASTLSTALAALLFYVPGRTYFQELWRHPYPFQLFAFVVGFILVFRSNLGYSRFWEGRSHCQLLTAHWTDMAVKALAFEAASTAACKHTCSGGGSSAARAEPAPTAFVDQLLHAASLLHGLCLQGLRRDWCLANLSQHTPHGPPPPVDAAGLPGYPVGPLQLLCMRAGAAARLRYHRAMRLPVLGALAPAERAALGEGFEQAGAAETETLFTGLDQGPAQQAPSLLQRLNRRLELQTGVTVPGAATRTVIAYTWLHLLLAQRCEPGCCAAWQLAPPTTAGVFALLSQGWAAFEACRKLSETPFPFPWAQMMALLLLIYSVTLPIMMCGWLNNIWLVLLMNFVSVHTYHALNEVARDLEDCFVLDPNDAPLARMQFDFNERLLAAAQAAGVPSSFG